MSGTIDYSTLGREQRDAEPPAPNNENPKDDPATQQDQTPLYADKFVEIFSDHIVLSQYYFPVGSKTILFKDIVSVKTNKELGLGLFDYKGWGMAVNDIWWALDIRRSSFSDRKFFVIEKRGDSTRKGFSAENPDEVERLLHKLV